MAIRLNYTADAINNLLGKMEKIKGDETTVTLSQNGVLSLKSLPIDNTTLQFSGSTLQINETWLNDKIAEVVGAQKPTLQSISLTASNQSLTVGQTLQLGVIPNPSSYPVSGVQWTSSNTAFATVVNGLVTAIAPGTARITATMEGKQAICDINVAAASTPVTSITLNSTTISGTEGGSAVLTATVNPTTATDTLTFTSSNTEVVSVEKTTDTSCVCRFLKAGDAVITVVSSNGKSASCNVRVAAANTPVTSITLTGSSHSVVEGGSDKLNVVVKPDNATNKAVIFSSSIPSIISVDSEGNCSFNHTGTATITAEAADGSGVKGTWQYVVAAAITPVESVSFAQPTVEGFKGETVTLKANIFPSDASERVVVFESMDPSKVVLTQTVVQKAANEVGCTLSGVGTAKVKATCGGKDAYCEVTVKSVAATGITLDKTSYNGFDDDSKVVLTATVSPDNVTDNTIIFVSNNPSVVEIENGSNGTAYAVIKGQGSATVTASCGDVSATCVFTIENRVTPVDSVEISPNTLSGKMNETAFVSARVHPSEASDTNVTFTSDNTEIVTVDSESGEVTFIYPGTANITASCGGKSASCVVTVNHPPVYVGNIEVGDAYTINSVDDVSVFISQLTNEEIQSMVDNNQLVDKTDDLLSGKKCETGSGRYNVRAICVPMSMYNEGYIPVVVDAMDVEQNNVPAATVSTKPVSCDCMNFNGMSYYVFGTYYSAKNTGANMMFKLIKNNS